MSGNPISGPIIRFGKRAWIPLLLIVVLSVSALVVSRLHKVFGSQDLNANAGKGIEIVQFNPKVVVYDITGPPGATANINYWDAEANTHATTPSIRPPLIASSHAVLSCAVPCPPAYWLAGLASNLRPVPELGFAIREAVGDNPRVGARFPR